MIHHRSGLMIGWRASRVKSGLFARTAEHRDRRFADGICGTNVQVAGEMWGMGSMFDIEGGR